MLLVSPSRNYWWSYHTGFIRAHCRDLTAASSNAIMLMTGSNWGVSRSFTPPTVSLRAGKIPAVHGRHAGPHLFYFVLRDTCRCFAPRASYFPAANSIGRTSLPASHGHWCHRSKSDAWPDCCRIQIVERDQGCLTCYVPTDSTARASKTCKCCCTCYHLRHIADRG